ncbi:MAG: hypothetical protein ACN6ON_06945 [Sphingobacterium sp.]
MKTPFNLSRLRVGLAEFYYLYRKNFRTMALLVLILAIVCNFYLSKILFDFMMRDGKESLSIATAHQLIGGKLIIMRQLMFAPMLLTIPILYQFIKRVRTKVSRNLMPFSKWENTLIPILGTIAILFVLSVEIFLLDTAFTQTYRWLFYDDAMRLLAQDGQLYPYIERYSYFNFFPLSHYLSSFNNFFVISLIVMIVLLSIWKLSFLRLMGLFLLVGGIYLANFWISFRTYNWIMIAIENNNGIPQFICNIGLLIISLYIIKHLFKESQV